MAFDEAIAWKVRYPTFGKDFDATFDKLVYSHEVNSSISVANHYFSIRGQESEDFIVSMKRVLDGLSNGAAFEFQIMDSTEAKKSTLFKHIVHSYEMDISLESATATITLQSLEKIAGMNVIQKNRSHEYASLTDMTAAICGENGFPFTSVSDAGTAIDFEILRQSDMTDYMFIWNHIIPRCNGAYMLFSKDGEEICFCKPGEGAKEFIPAPEQLKRVVDAASPYETARRGGNILMLDSLDPKKKEPLDYKTGPEAPGSISSGPVPRSVPEMGVYMDDYPVQTPEALEAWTNSHQNQHAWDAAPFRVVLRGSDTIGEKAIELPMILNLEGTKFKDNDNKRAIVWQIVHTVSGGRYTMDFACVRDKIEAD